jgi:PAS domain-containing protein
MDIWANRAAELGLIREGNVLIGDEYVPFEELSATEFYRDFLSTHDVAHLLTAIVYAMDSLASDSPVVCSFFRGPRAGPFNAIDRDRFTILVPHLSRSIGVMTRLRRAEVKAAAGLASLDRLSTGVLLFNGGGGVTFANRSARRILEEIHPQLLYPPFVVNVTTIIGTHVGPNGLGFAAVGLLASLMLTETRCGNVTVHE